MRLAQRLAPPGRGRRSAAGASRVRGVLPTLLALLALSACAPYASPATSNAPAQQPAPAQSAPASNRPLIVVNLNEPVSLNARPLTETFISYFTVRQIFNASLIVLDDKGLPRARLA